MMTVDIRESVASELFQLAYAGKRHRISQSPNWKTFIGNKPDITAPLFIEFKTRRGPFFYETKRYSDQEIYEQIQSYWRMYLLTQEMPILQTNAPTIVLPRIVNVRYNNRDLINNLLGSQGKGVLRKILNLIDEIVNEENWPISRIGINHVTDLEVKDWQYILFVLFFNSDFDTADKYLHDFYKKLDDLIDTFNADERDIFLRNFYFDVEPTAVSIA